MVDARRLELLVAVCAEVAVGRFLHRSFLVRQLNIEGWPALLMGSACGTTDPRREVHRSPEVGRLTTVAVHMGSTGPSMSHLFLDIGTPELDLLVSHCLLSVWGFVENLNL